MITVTGEVVPRAPDAVNPKLATGEVELAVRELTVLSAAEPLPLQVASDAEFPEETRLRYRFLDLRREQLHRNIVLRSRVIASIRRRMIDGGFTEFQTPILTSSSPEGARDYLVPSRVHPGKFYALPAGAPAVQAAPDGGGLRPILPDRAVLPGRGRPGRPLARRVLPARLRDVVRDPGGRLARRSSRCCTACSRSSRPDGAVTPAPFPRIAFDEAMARTAPTSRTCATRS